jgi:hypothetical protein
MAKIEDDDMKSWYRRAPVPRPAGHREPGDISLSDDTKYIHSMYWSIVTFSHIGLGDITAITYKERLFNCLVVLVTYAAYGLLFGNMASLVSNLTSHMREDLYKKYSFVLEYLDKKKLNKYRRQIEDYFSYVWLDDIGMDEDAMIGDLPIEMQNDIKYERYKSVIHGSEFFKTSGYVNDQLVVSVMRVMRKEYYMEDDYIISKIDSSSDVFLILHGTVELEYGD